MFTFFDYYVAWFYYYLGIHYLVELAGGGVDASSPAPPVQGPPSVLPLIAGPTEDITRNAVQFSLIVELELASSGTTHAPGAGSFPLFEHHVIRALSNGFVSAELVGELSVKLIPGINVNTTTALIANCWVAVGTAASTTHTHTIGNRLGARCLFASSLGAESLELPFPPGIQRNALVSATLGDDPYILWYYTANTTAKSYLQVVGYIKRHGLGYIDTSLNA